MKAAVITVSDRGAAGQRDDGSGSLLMELISDLPAEMAFYRIVPDEPVKVRETVLEAAASVGSGIVLTTGGTGLSPRDTTPEAILPVFESEFPGVMEIIRRDGRRSTPYAALSRGVAGRIGRALVIALPGSPRAIREAWPRLESLIGEMLSEKMLT
jgi:molybdenum cofactor synthesis domain-containing protein